MRSRTSCCHHLVRNNTGQGNCGGCCHALRKSSCNCHHIRIVDNIISVRISQVQSRRTNISRTKASCKNTSTEGGSHYSIICYVSASNFKIVYANICHPIVWLGPTRCCCTKICCFPNTKISTYYNLIWIVRIRLNG